MKNTLIVHQQRQHIPATVSEGPRGWPPSEQHPSLASSSGSVTAVRPGQQQPQDREAGHHWLYVSHHCCPQAASPPSDSGDSNCWTKRRATIGYMSIIVASLGQHHGRCARAKASKGPRGWQPSAPCPLSSGSVTAVRLG
jgi:hypothetical protein